MNPVAKALLIAGFLIFGAINTLTKKFQFQTCSVGVPEEHVPAAASAGCPDGTRHFQKPWFQNLMMFSGESILFVVYLARRKGQDRLQENAVPLVAGSEGRPKRLSFWVFLAPACCDVLATGISGVGMLYISASVWQMMRGSVIVFTSFLSITFLGRELHTYNWVAVCVSVCGLCLVGASAILDQGGGGSNIKMGIICTIAGQFFTASQFVVEEMYVKKYQAPAEQVVGSEGIWGIGIMLVLLTVMYHVPGSDVGATFENGIDAAVLLENSGPLQCLVGGYCLSIATFNFLGVTISKELSAVHRTINDALRTAIVWGVQLALFYGGSTEYGQGLMPHSWMQAVGFVFLVCGTMINSQVLKLPCISYPGGPGKMRPMGAGMMSPGRQSISLLSFPGSPLASPSLHAFFSPKDKSARKDDTVAINFVET